MPSRRVRVDARDRLGDVLEREMLEHEREVGPAWGVDIALRWLLVARKPERGEVAVPQPARSEPSDRPAGASNDSLLERSVDDARQDSSADLGPREKSLASIL